MVRAIKIMRGYLETGDVRTPMGRAIVEERYRALRRQVPVIYLVALVNLLGLQLATTGELVVGLNPPTAMTICALIRIGQWMSQRKKQLSPLQMRARLRQTVCIVACFCFFVALWCLQLIKTADATAALAILLFGSLAAIGTAYGLSSYPTAARLPLLVLAFPLAGEALLSDNPFFVGAAVSLTIVSLLIPHLLGVHNSHFTDLIRSAAKLADEQQLSMAAHRTATKAATTDFLTGLPNRRAFVAAIEKELANNGHDTTFGLAIVDLDKFKPINDTFGHATGDELLRIIADRLKLAAGSDATVARLGGDEFAILFPEMQNAAAAEELGQRILEAVNRPADIHGRQFPISACCGIAVSRRRESQTSTHFIAQADIALYEAKGATHSRLSIFEPLMEEPRRRRAKVERALSLPEVGNDIKLVYQPIFDLRTGRITALEALARWTDTELGDVSPAEFIPIAEQLDVISSLTETLLKKAIVDAVSWHPKSQLSFNLSAVQLCSAGSADAILKALEKGGLCPSRLHAEVTETTLLADFERARENLLKLRSAGVLIVLDDFGAGYASISYLKEIRFDQIKLDGSLVTAAQDCGERQQLLGAVIGLCQALGVPPVAEHIETQEQLNLLKLGCCSGQGYWLHRPMTAYEARVNSAEICFLPRAYGTQSRMSAA